MSLVLRSTMSALAPGRFASFGATGGAEPYSYAVLSGGAGGTIDAATGAYTAPAAANSDPAKSYDVIEVTDDDSATALLPILVTDALGLVCEIIEREMGLAPGRVYFWDQKIMQPTDSGLYVAVAMINPKAFANTMSFESGAGVDAVQSVNMMGVLSIDLISRDLKAYRRKEDLLMALASNYSQTQQQRNSFFIGRLPAGGQFVNLSNIDGAAIPYRYNLSVNIQYFATVTKAVDYFDDFDDVDVVTEP